METYLSVMIKTKGKNRHITLEMVYDIENLKLADKIARKGKSKNYGVRLFDKYKWKNLRRLRKEIKAMTYKTPQPKIELQLCDNNKIRSLSKLPYYYHVAHHALMNVIMPVIHKSYYYESSASITGRGIHYAVKHVRKFLDKNRNKDLWWAQLDFVKFYHNVKRDKIYESLCEKFTDPGIRWLLRDVIWALGSHNGLEESDGNTGMGIGLYPVQPLVNFYLNKLDRKLAALPGIKMYRYCDNILLIGTSAKAVWDAINLVLGYAKDVMEQPVHDNIGVQKLDEKHPIDFIGYKFYKTYTWIRDSIKYKFKRKVKKYSSNINKLMPVLAAYKGWLMHCSGLKLWRRVTGINVFSELGLSKVSTTLEGKRVFSVEYTPLYQLDGKKVIIEDFEEGCTTKFGSRTYVLYRDAESNVQKKFCTANVHMIDTLKEAKEKGLLPFIATIASRRYGANKVEYYFT